MFNQAQFPRRDCIPTPQDLYQILLAFSRYPVTLKVYSDRDGTVPQLLLDISRRDVVHEQNGRVGVPQIVGIAAS